MAPQVRALASKPKYLNLAPRTDPVKGGEKGFLNVRV